MFIYCDIISRDVVKLSKKWKTIAFGSCFCYTFLKSHNILRVYVTVYKYGEPFYIF